MEKSNMDTNTDARNFTWYEQLNGEMENLGYQVLIRGPNFWIVRDGKLLEACSSVAELAMVFRCLKNLSKGKWVLCEDKTVMAPDESYRVLPRSGEPPP